MPLPAKHSEDSPVDRRLQEIQQTAEILGDSNWFIRILWSETRLQDLVPWPLAAIVRGDVAKREGAGNSAMTLALVAFGATVFGAGFDPAWWASANLWCLGLVYASTTLLTATNNPLFESAVRTNPRTVLALLHPFLFSMMAGLAGLVCCAFASGAGIGNYAARLIVLFGFFSMMLNLTYMLQMYALGLLSTGRA